MSRCNWCLEFVCLTEENLVGSAQVNRFSPNPMPTQREPSGEARIPLRLEPKVFFLSFDAVHTGSAKRGEHVMHSRVHNEHTEKHPLTQPS